MLWPIIFPANTVILRGVQCQWRAKFVVCSDKEGNNLAGTYLHVNSTGRWRAGRKSLCSWLK